jgi:hypothetical protein
MKQPEKIVSYTAIPETENSYGRVYALDANGVLWVSEAARDLVDGPFHKLFVPLNLPIA